MKTKQKTIRGNVVWIFLGKCQYQYDCMNRLNRYDRKDYFTK